MTQEKIVEAILEVAPEVFDCAPDAPEAKLWAGVIASRLHEKGVIVPPSRCHECKYSKFSSSDPGRLLCANKRGASVNVDGYCDEGQKKNEWDELCERANREATLIELKAALEFHEREGGSNTWKASQKN